MPPPAFLGQVGGSSWSLHRHTHPETSREWAPSGPSHPWGPAAQLQPVGFRASLSGAPFWFQVVGRELGHRRRDAVLGASDVP